MTMLNKLKQFWERNIISDFPHYPACFDCGLPSCKGCRVGKLPEVTKGGPRVVIKNKPIYDLNKKARAILINGRPFVRWIYLSEWMGFRWGKAEISVRVKTAGYPGVLWQAKLYSKNDSWNLDADWDLEILRNLNAALDEKLRVQERRRQLTGVQKFYGNLTLKELAN